jgi:hypothetical protein
LLEDHDATPNTTAAFCSTIKIEMPHAAMSLTACITASP